MALKLLPSGDWAIRRCCGEGAGERRSFRCAAARVSLSLFFIYLLVLLWMSGVHTHAIVLMNVLGWHEMVQIVVPNDVCAQLCDCALQFESIWESKEIEFHVIMEERAMIYADANLMELVWNNLLSNAFKFTPSGGAVTLKQTSDDQGIWITVADTGCGMDKETLGHIYEKFYQGDSSRATQGNGLGLVLAWRVLQLMC